MIFFFFNDTATTEIYTLSLHDALPISAASSTMVHSLKVCDMEGLLGRAPPPWGGGAGGGCGARRRRGRPEQGVVVELLRQHPGCCIGRAAGMAADGGGERVQPGGPGPRPGPA